jgi:hypothetical protein
MNYCLLVLLCAFSCPGWSQSYRRADSALVRRWDESTVAALAQRAAGPATAPGHRFATDDLATFRAARFPHGRDRIAFLQVTAGTRGGSPQEITLLECEAAGEVNAFYTVLLLPQKSGWRRYDYRYRAGTWQLLRQQFVSAAAYARLFDEATGEVTGENTGYTLLTRLGPDPSRTKVAYYPRFSLRKGSFLAGFLAPYL